MDPHAHGPLPPNHWRGGQLIATISVSLTLAMITLILRLWCRFKVVKTPGWDDLTILLATCAAIIQATFNLLFVHWGGARHAVYLTKTEMLHARKWENLAMIPFTLCTAITKISIAFMVIRLTNKKWMKYCMYALMASQVLFNGGSLVVYFTYCHPSRAVWDFVPTAKCGDIRVLQITSNVQGAWSIFTDLVCTLTPLALVWQLQMRTGKKVSVTVLIGFGLLVTGFSIARIVAYNKTQLADYTWNGIDSTIYTTLEGNIGIMAANLPPLGMLTSLIYEKVKNSSSMRYLLSRSGRSTEKSGSNGGPMVTIGGSGRKESQNSDYQLMSSQSSAKEGLVRVSPV